MNEATSGIPLTEAVSRLTEIESGSDELRAAVLAALTAASIEELGRAVLLVARDRINARAMLAQGEADAAQVTLAAMRSSRDPAGPAP